MSSLKKKVDSLPKFPPPLLSSPLSPKQWQQFDAQLARTEAEFEIRRRLLITRLSASIGSFLWAEKAERHKGTILDAMARAELGKRSEPLSQARVMAASQVRRWKAKGLTVRCIINISCRRMPS